jgi:cellulose synthase (UDP-forming)
MDYPAGKVTVWLLDDGGTDQKCADPDPVKARKSKSRRAALRMLCDDLGANYLTRPRNEHAKAGNLNNGLAHSKAPIVVVFDADHVPFKSFLRETIGHFSRDPKLFLVQTPHVFLNRDPIERNLRTFDRMPSENEMFYAVTQRGLDKWNGSFFCGSAAVLRRAALQQTGGFSGLTVTEDCETAFELHRSGWTSVYVDKPLTAGLQPETFESFIGQRSRWCQGMFQLFLMKSPLFKRGLTPIQRVAYLSSMTYWFFPLPRLIFMFAPLLYIFFDVKLFVSTVEESIAYAATYVIVNAMMHNQLYDRFCAGGGGRRIIAGRMRRGAADGGCSARTASGGADFVAAPAAVAARLAAVGRAGERVGAGLCDAAPGRGECPLSYRLALLGVGAAGARDAHRRRERDEDPRRAARRGLWPSAHRV